MKIIKGSDIFELGKSMAALENIAVNANHRGEVEALRTALAELVEAASGAKAWLQLFAHTNEIFKTPDTELQTLISGLDAAILKAKSEVADVPEIKR